MWQRHCSAFGLLPDRLKFLSRPIYAKETRTCGVAAAASGKGESRFSLSLPKRSRARRTVPLDLQSGFPFAREFVTTMPTGLTDHRSSSRTRPPPSLFPLEPSKIQSTAHRTRHRHHLRPPLHGSAFAPERLALLPALLLRFVVLPKSREPLQARPCAPAISRVPPTPSCTSPQFPGPFHWPRGQTTARRRRQASRSRASHAWTEVVGEVVVVG
jgi:hypothetical protein